MRGRRSPRAYLLFACILAVVVLYSGVGFYTSDGSRDKERFPSKNLIAENGTAAKIPRAREEAKDRKNVIRVHKQAALNFSGICYGLCSPDKSVSQDHYVREAVKRYLSEFKKTEISKTTAISQKPTTFKPRRSRWTINEASLFQKGSQPKLVLQLSMAGGIRTAIFKPRLDGPLKSSTPCSGFDRYDSELAAYYFRRMMHNFVDTTLVIGVQLDLERDVWPARDERLRNNTWITEDGRYCVNFICVYCHDLAICGDQRTKSTIEGSLSFWVPEKLERIRNPWSSDCAHKGVEKWRQNSALCPQLYLSDEFYSDRRTLLDVVDAGIFDFLVSNPDRHTFEYWKNGSQRHIVLLDNGKAFPNADYDDISLLASLFQCCMIRERTYSLLRHFSDASVLVSNFRSLMASDPIYPFLDEPHLSAVPQRIRKAIVVVDLCIEKYGFSAVLLAD